MQNAIEITTIVTHRLTKFGMPIDIINIIVKLVFDDAIKKYNLEKKMLSAISKTSAMSDNNICRFCANEYINKYECTSCNENICWDCRVNCERCDDIFCKNCFDLSIRLCGLCKEQKYCDNCKNFETFEDCPHCIKLYELYSVKNSDFSFCSACHDCINDTNPYTTIGQFRETYGSSKTIYLTGGKEKEFIKILKEDFDIKYYISSAEGPSDYGSRKIWRNDKNLNLLHNSSFKSLTFIRWLVEVVFDLKFEGSRLDNECRKIYVQI
jgi:hypothetical protein